MDYKVDTSGGLKTKVSISDTVELRVNSSSKEYQATWAWDYYENIPLQNIFDSTFDSTFQ